MMLTIQRRSRCDSRRLSRDFSCTRVSRQGPACQPTVEMRFLGGRSFSSDIRTSVVSGASAHEEVRNLNSRALGLARPSPTAIQGRARAESAAQSNKNVARRTA
jgi:hypothetical protein